MNRSSQIFYYDIAVSGPLGSALTYSYSTVLSPGQKVLVPLGFRKEIGIVLNLSDKQSCESYDFKIKLTFF